MIKSEHTLFFSIHCDLYRFEVSIGRTAFLNILTLKGVILQFVIENKENAITAKTLCLIHYRSWSIQWADQKKKIDV